MTGLSDRLMLKQMEGSNKNSKCNKSPYNNIKIENIIVSFVILISGVAISVLCIIFEFVLLKKAF